MVKGLKKPLLLLGIRSRVTTIAFGARVPRLYGSLVRDLFAVALLRQCVAPNGDNNKSKDHQLAKRPFT